jgi:arylsulfatase A-like enzyme
LTAYLNPEDKNVVIYCHLEIPQESDIKILCMDEIRVKKTWPLFALLLLLLLPACGRGTGRAIILISLDTLRQDHLGCYGYGRDTSPHIDRFAKEEGILFEAAYAQAPLTLPSHMSILTGLYPETHGILLPKVKAGKKGGSDRLSENVVTLAEAIKNQGFETSAFTDGLLVAKRFGFNQGFDEYRDQRNKKGDNGFRRFGKPLKKWIDDHAKEDFFLFIHTYDTHAPYLPPEPFLSKFQEEPPARELPEASLVFCSFLGIHKAVLLNRYGSLQEVVDAYDGCVSFVDTELGKLFSQLKDLGLWEDSLIVVTSDHGESFMENDLMIGHGICAGNEETLIPLIIKLPGSEFSGTRINHVVESVDIMPTVLSALGVSVPSGVQGQDMLPGVKDGLWKKDYAYGTSPNTGNNHYFVRKGIKFIGAVNDPRGGFMKGMLIPDSPPTSDKPAEPYNIWKNKEYFYDFDLDPLGLSELFQRGDRAYDISRSKYEWKSKAIEETEVLKNYKKAAHLIASRSRELGKRFSKGNDAVAALTEEEKEQLTGLGYAGIITAAELSAEGPDAEGGSKLALTLEKPLIDRSLLHEGDEVIWEISRTFANAGRKMKAREFDKRIESARACYEEFKKRFPHLHNLVDWRMKYLDYASRHRSGIVIDR